MDRNSSHSIFIIRFIIVWACVTTYQASGIFVIEDGVQYFIKNHKSELCITRYNLGSLWGPLKASNWPCQDGKDTKLFKFELEPSSNSYFIKVTTSRFWGPIPVLTGDRTNLFSIIPLENGYFKISNSNGHLLTEASDSKDLSSEVESYSPLQEWEIIEENDYINAVAKNGYDDCKNDPNHIEWINGECFRPLETHLNKTHEEAEELCSAAGGYLPVLNEDRMRRLVAGAFRAQGIKRSWLSLYQKANQTNKATGWEWVFPNGYREDLPVVGALGIHPWRDGEPDDWNNGTFENETNRANGGALHRSGTLLDQQPKGWNTKTICQFVSRVTTTSCDSSMSFLYYYNVDLENHDRCHISSTVNGLNTENWCYWLETGTTTRSNANNRCSNLEGELAQISSMYIHKLLVSELLQSASVSEVWVGMKDDGTQWVDAEANPVYLAWEYSYHSKDGYYAYLFNAPCFNAVGSESSSYEIPYAICQRKPKTTTTSTSTSSTTSTSTSSTSTSSSTTSSSSSSTSSSTTSSTSTSTASTSTSTSSTSSTSSSTTSTSTSATTTTSTSTSSTSSSSTSSTSATTTTSSSSTSSSTTASSTSSTSATSTTTTSATTTTQTTTFTLPKDVEAKREQYITEVNEVIAAYNATKPPDLVPGSDDDLAWSAFEDLKLTTWAWETLGYLPPELEASFEHPMSTNRRDPGFLSYWWTHATNEQRQLSFVKGKPHLSMYDATKYNNEKLNSALSTLDKKTIAEFKRMPIFNCDQCAWTENSLIPGYTKMCLKHPALEDQRICVCNQGYMSNDCGLMIQWCRIPSENRCQNGDCIESREKATCKCWHGYAGEYCQDKLSAMYNEPFDLWFKITSSITIVEIGIGVGLHFVLWGTQFDRAVIGDPNDNFLPAVTLQMASDAAKAMSHIVRGVFPVRQLLGSYEIDDVSWSLVAVAHNTFLIASALLTFFALRQLFSQVDGETNIEDDHHRYRDNWFSISPGVEWLPLTVISLLGGFLIPFGCWWVSMEKFVSSHSIGADHSGFFPAFWWYGTALGIGFAPAAIYEMTQIFYRSKIDFFERLYDETLTPFTYDWSLKLGSWGYSILGLIGFLDWLATASTSAAFNNQTIGPAAIIAGVLAMVGGGLSIYFYLACIPKVAVRARLKINRQTFKTDIEPKNNSTKEKDRVAVLNAHHEVYRGLKDPKVLATDFLRCMAENRGSQFPRDIPSLSAARNQEKHSSDTLQSALVRSEWRKPSRRIKSKAKKSKKRR